VKRAAWVLCVACHASTSTNPAPSTSAPSAPNASTNAPSASASTSTSTRPTLRTITIDERGIGFDDLVFVKASHHVLVPAGALGALVTVSTTTDETQSRLLFPILQSFGGMAGGDAGGRRILAAPYTPGRHDVGLTSAAESAERTFVTDRTTKRLVAVDGNGFDAEIALASEPDYVRFVPPDELWVTEPDAGQIEIFGCCSPSPEDHAGADRHAHVFTKRANVSVRGGPESLVVSPSRKMAYANLWHAKSVEIDVTKRAITRTFDSGCDKSRGIALDDAGGGLFVACNDGRVAKIDLASGKIAAEGHAGDGVDIIDFSPKTGHLYVPAARAGTLTVFDAKLAVLKTVPVPKGAHCVVADDRGQAWVCDPDHGSLVVFSENP